VAITTGIRRRAAEARIRELNTGLEHQIAERTAELRRLNVLLGSVLQAASEVSIITLDRDGIISGFNLGAERMLGYRADEVVGKASPTLLHSERELLARGQELGEEGFRVLVARAEQEGAETREWTYLRKDGSPLSVTLSVTVLRDEAGAINGYLGIAVDVTEWRNAEREMAAARDQLQMAADVARLGIWRWNLADDSLQWNERMCELYGQPLALRDGGLVYEHWRSRLHSEDLERTEASLRAAVEGRGNYDVIFRVVLPDGGIRFIQAGAQVERDADGNPLQVTGINIDITSDQQLQARLREAKEQADAASAAKSSFLANMSHEIRTPLNAIVGFAKLIGEVETEEEKQQFIDIIDVNSELLQLINDILDISKIEAGTLEFRFRPMNLNDLCRSELEVHKPRVKPGVELVFEERVANVEIVCDQNRLAQVISNLLNNAGKFTEEGEIRFGFDLKDGCVEFFVQDTGMGIPPEKARNIFDRFVKLNDFAAGTGLGLAISKMIVEKLDGTIGVDSEPGKGTRFHFSIPVVHRDGGKDDEQHCAAPGRDDGKSWVLLVAEDSDTNFRLIEAVLSRRFSLVRAHTGAEAVDMFGTVQPDAVLMDIRMPVMDGLEATRRIRSVSADVPIIAMSAYSSGSEIESARNAGCNEFLVKPLSQYSLHRALNAALVEFKGKGKS